MSLPITPLVGSYRINNRAIIEEKAARHGDPRHVFYKAMLRYETYEDYLREVGALKVLPPPKWNCGRVTGRREILYARSSRNRWISDI
jgi:hypothetical protein